MAGTALSHPRPVITPLTAFDRALRTLWAVVYLILFRPSPRPLHAWRRAILRLFGAKIGRGARVYPSVKIWAPWNLVLGDRACLGYYVDCYNCDRVTVEEDAIVSQYTLLCTGTHDYRYLELPLITAPVVVKKKAWVCADSFLAPGVVVGEGAVVGARSSVFHDVEPWTVVAGHPARVLRRRELCRGS